MKLNTTSSLVAVCLTGLLCLAQLSASAQIKDRAVNVGKSKVEQTQARTEKAANKAANKAADKAEAKADQAAAKAEDAANRAADKANAKAEQL